MKKLNTKINDEYYVDKFESTLKLVGEANLTINYIINKLTHKKLSRYHINYGMYKTFLQVPRVWRCLIKMIEPDPKKVSNDYMIIVYLYVNDMLFVDNNDCMIKFTRKH
jgi:hypothetical protein